MANSIVMRMRIFNHQNTNPMAVLVKGQPFLIDKLTHPHNKDGHQDPLHLHTPNRQTSSPQLTTSPHQLTEGPATGTPIPTEGDLQAGPTIPLPPQKGN